MKILKEQSKNFAGDIVTTYDFDNLGTINDFMHIINVFMQCGVKIKSVRVREFGDYDAGNDSIIYTDVSKLNLMYNDFLGKTIQCYVIIGNFNDCELVASIYPNSNRLKISYLPQLKDYVNNVAGKISRM